MFEVEYDSLYDFYLENQLVIAHIPLGTQLELGVTAYELETGQISRTEAYSMATYYAAVSFAHMAFAINKVEHMMRAQGVLATNVPAPLAKTISRVALRS